MVKIESQPTPISRPSKDIFEFLTNFTNFEALIPQQVEEWKATEDSCSFRVPGVAQLGMKILEKQPFSSITIINDPEIPSPVGFKFFWILEEKNGETIVTASFNLDLNAMMAMMVKKPLQSMVDVLVSSLKKKMEN